MSVSKESSALNDAAQQQAIAEFIRQRCEADAVSITAMRRLSGGAIQENWSLDVSLAGGELNGAQEWVLRADAISAVSDSHSRPQEFALLKAVFDAGVTVPEPILLGDKSVFGRDFFIMKRVKGLAAGFKIVRDPTLGGDKEKLAERIGEEMAKIHTVLPPRVELAFLPEPNARPALSFIQASRAYLDKHHTPFPALEWGLRWLEINAPETPQLVLTHRDFRTGNYMVDESGLTAVLDWEFAAWSDPLDDIGWFCAKCWRFGQNAKEAGGISSREALYRGYERISGKKIDPASIFYWEVFAHMRWAMIAIRQGERQVSGTELSLELALTAHVVPELELEILRMTGAAPN